MSFQDQLAALEDENHALKQRVRALEQAVRVERATFEGAMERLSRLEAKLNSQTEEG